MVVAIDAEVDYEVYMLDVQTAFLKADVEAEVFAASDLTALPLMDRFTLLRYSLLTVPRLDLNHGVPEDMEHLNRTYHIETSFNKIFNKFHRFLIMHCSVIRGRMLLLAGVINQP